MGGVELDNGIGPIGPAALNPRPSGRSVVIRLIIGPGKMPIVCEEGEWLDIKGESMALAPAGLCLRKGFFGGSPGRL